jgi:uncharacterized membrane protein YwzB
MAFELLKRSAVDVLVILAGIIIGVALAGVVYVGIGTDAVGGANVSFLNLRGDREWISWLAGILFSMAAVWAIQSVRLKLRKKRRSAGPGP